MFRQDVKNAAQAGNFVKSLIDDIGKCLRRSAVIAILRTRELLLARRHSGASASTCLLVAENRLSKAEKTGDPRDYQAAISAGHDALGFLASDTNERIWVKAHTLLGSAHQSLSKLTKDDIHSKVAIGSFRQGLLFFNREYPPQHTSSQFRHGPDGEILEIKPTATNGDFKSLFFKLGMALHNEGLTTWFEADETHIEIYGEATHLKILGEAAESLQTWIHLSEASVFPTGAFEYSVYGGLMQDIARATGESEHWEEAAAAWRHAARRAGEAGKPMQSMQYHWQLSEVLLQITELTGDIDRSAEAVELLREIVAHCQPQEDFEGLEQVQARIERADQQIAKLRGDQLDFFITDDRPNRG